MAAACSFFLVFISIVIMNSATNPLLIKDPKTGLHSSEFYARCMVGGFAACGFTHAAVVTLDVAKVRTQAHSKAGKWPSGLIPSVSRTWQLEGVAGITKGWVPTFWGYGAQASSEPCSGICS